MSFLNTASSNIQPLGLVVVAFVFFFLRLPFIFFFESYITVVINPRLYYDCLENSCDTLNQSKCKIKTKRFFLTRFSCLIFVFHSVFPRFRQFAYSILFWALIGSLWYVPSFWLAVVIVSIFWFYNAPTYICHLEFGREWFLNRSQYKFFLTLRLCYEGRENIPTFCCLFFHSNNNRNSRKMAGKKFQPLSQEMSDRSDVPDGSYSCSPSKQGPLRLKLSSKLLCFTFSLLT